MPVDSETRQLLVVRHGERCDFVFNQPGRKSWVRRAFDSNGKYVPFDINLPRNVPKRRDGWEQFEKDSPLTEMGYLQSKLVGRSLRDNSAHVDYVYCSHALRCVQTAVGIIKGLGSAGASKMEINVEPGLYEWMQWCRGIRPSAMGIDELAKNGYPVNTNYVPTVRESDLRLDESLQEYYNRSDSVVRSILRRHPSGTILLVAHSGSLEACTRQICGGEPRTSDEFFHILRSTPFLASVRAKEARLGATGTGVWYTAGSPVPPLSHGGNGAFEPELLQMTSEQLREHAEKNKRYLI